VQKVGFKVDFSQLVVTIATFMIGQYRFKLTSDKSEIPKYVLVESFKYARLELSPGGFINLYFIKHIVCFLPEVMHALLEVTSSALRNIAIGLVLFISYLLDGANCFEMVFVFIRPFTGRHWTL
jgi:hypothetical protein